MNKKLKIYKVIILIYSKVRVMPKVIKPEDDIKRQEIMDKILLILGKKQGEVCLLKQTNLPCRDNEVTFFLSKMDKDEEKQNLIYELETEIKKYYICSKWACFNTAKDTKRKWLSIIKYICKEHGKKMETGNIKYADGKYDTVYKLC